MPWSGGVREVTLADMMLTCGPEIHPEGGSTDVFAGDPLSQARCLIPCLHKLSKMMNYLMAHISGLPSKPTS